MRFLVRSILLVILVCFQASFSFAQDWQKLYNESLDYFDQGDFDATITKGKEALESAETDITRLFTLKLLSTAASESGQFEEGVAFGIQEVALSTALEMPDSVMYNSLHTLGINLLSIEDYENAKGYLKSSSLSAYSHYGESSYEYNQALSELGLVYYMVDDLDSAIFCLEAANKNLIDIPEGGSDFLDNMYLTGLIWFEQEDHVRAAKAFGDLKNILELNDLSSELIYAETCENLGTINYQQGKYDEAESTLLASLAAYSALGFGIAESKEIINTLALTYIKKGEQNKSDSLMALLEPDDLSKNVFINQINIANSYYVEKEYDESSNIINSVENKLNLESDAALLAEVYLLQTKLNLAKGENSSLEKINFCITTFMSANNNDRLIESFLYKARIYTLYPDLENAENTISEAISYTESNTVSQKYSYQIFRESLSIFLRQNKLVEARAIYDRVVDESFLDNSIQEDLTYSYAILLQTNGQLFESSTLLNQLIASGTTKISTYRIALIQSLITQSIYTEARYELDNLKKSINENQTKDNLFVLVQMHSLSAKVFLYLGDYSHAEEEFRNSLKILNDSDIENKELEADVLNSTAIFYQTIGNYAEAERLYLEAKTMAIPGTSLALDIIQNLATLKQIEGLFEESIDLSMEALLGYELLYGSESPSYSTALQNLATAYRQTKNPIEALPFLEEAIRIDEHNNLQGSISHTTKLHNLAVLYQDLDSLEKAQVLFKQVVERRREVLGESHPDYAFSLYNLAVVSQRMNKITEAKILFGETVEKYKVLIKDFFPYLSEKEKSAYYGKINEAFVGWLDFTIEYAYSHPESTRDLYDFQLEYKAALLNSSVDLRKKISASSDEETFAMFEEWLSLKEEGVKLMSLSESELKASNESISEIQDKANNLEKQLLLKSATFSDNLEASDVSWQDIKSNLKEGDAAIEIFRIRKNIRNDSIWYVALIVRHDTENYPEFEVFQNGMELENKWFKFYMNSIKFKMQDTQTFSHFWSPLEKHLDGIQRIFVAPDGIFNKISLNSLYDSENEKYLLEEYNVHYLSNIKEVVELDEHGNGKEKSITLFGNPKFDMAGDGTGIEGGMIAPLPGTALEVQLIEELLVNNDWSATLNTEMIASEKNIKEQENSDILHIATHGFFLTDNNPENEFYSLENNPLMRSGLLLAGAENTFTGNKIVINTSVDGEDGALTAFEVMNMDLKETDLVVLSACETGLGEIRNGEGVYGLQRAFVLAGVNSVMISLWKVNDEATKDLMISFYQHLLDGKSKFEALSEAQREMYIKYQDPYFWAAFVISGT